MIDLLATAPDGWALVRDEKGHWLVRPPYGLAERCRLTEAQVLRAVADEDFSPESQSFSGWGELCRSLEVRRVEKATHEEVESAGNAAALLLARATAEQARRHLARIRSEINRVHPSRLEATLIALMGSTAVQNDPTMIREVAEMLQLALHARFLVHASQPTRATWPVRDEVSVEQLAQEYRKLGSLLAHVA